MGLDFSRSVAQLSPERRTALIRDYRRQAKHDTTAFLYCFFLGTIGAHRMYLGQWGAALPRLALSAVFVADLALGIPLQWPAAAVIGVAVALLLVLLSWEIRDLFRIDAEVEQYNAALAERLLGGPLAAMATASQESQAASGADAAPAAVGTITASDIAGAFALAQGVTAGRVEAYPDGQALAFPALEPTAPEGAHGTNGVTHSTASPAADAPSAPLAITPSADLTDRHPQAHYHQPVADVEGTTAGAVYVALDAAPAMADPEATATQAATAVTATEAAATAAATVPTFTRDLTDSHPQAHQSHPVADIERAGAGAVYVALPQESAPSGATSGAGELAATSESATAPHGDEALLVLVPQEELPAGDIPTTDMRPWGMGSPAPSQPLSDEGDMLATTVPAAPMDNYVPADAYVPPTVSAVEETRIPVAPIAAAPVWPVTPEEAPPAPPIWPVQPSAQGQVRDQEQGDDTRTLAELAAFGGAAGAAAYAAEHAREHTQEHTHDHMPATESADAATAPAAAMNAPAAGSAEPPIPTDAPPATPPTAVPAESAPPQPMKRVRVVRKIVLEDGGVVRELVAERIVPMDADSQAIAAELEAQLGHATPEEIAELAHLPGDTSVVVHSRVESGPLSGKLTPPANDGGGGGGGTPPAQGS